jgi:hypothetical protein
MKHIRIPVSTGHPEAGWFGYLYLWQCQRNGAIGARLHMNDPRSWRRQDWEWDETRAIDALGPSHSPVPLEQDVVDILHDHFPHLRMAGTIQVKVGREWHGKVLVHSA